jgi:hypothetical protein
MLDQRDVTGRIRRVKMLKCDYKGYEIRWNDLTRKMCIFKEGIEVKENLPSFLESRRWIDSQSKKKFKRVPILYNFNYVAGEREKGEAIGFSGDELVWISSGKNRCKARPEYVWLDIPENQEILKKIKKKDKQIDQIKKEIMQLESKAKRLTKEMLLDK